MSELGLCMLFKVRLEERLIKCSASRDVNPWGHLHYQQKDFLSNCASPCLQKNISQNARLEHPNVNTSQSSYHTHRYSAGRDCQIVSLNALSHCSLFINRSVFHTCSFLLKAVILSWGCRRWLSFPWSEMFNWYNFAKISQWYANWVRKT